jgi:O-Antigen ligase
VRAAWLGLWRGDLLALAAGGGATLLVLLATQHSGAKLGAGLSLGLIAFAALMAAWLLAPHVVVGFTIPLFAVIPTAKLFVSDWLGPVKDAVTLAAGVAVLITVVRRHMRPDGTHVDSLLCVLILAFGGLYLVNLGGTIAGGGHGIAWAQGFRLVCEPLILLLAGLILPNPRRSLRVALVSLIATGVVVALYGIYQQYLGGARLVALGYSYQDQVRRIGGHLRSFGTLDDPFLYAAFLLLALSAALWWMQRGPLKTVCVSLMAFGVLLSYVRSAILIAVALAAIWLIRTRRVVVGVVLLVASLAAAIAFLVAVSGANETHSVRAGPNTYITLNGRTSVWATVFSKPAEIPFGLGVGKVGTAAQRAQFGVVKDPTKATKGATAVDSGYFATVADVGIVGFLVLLALLTRLVVLGLAAIRRFEVVGWLVLGWLAVMLIDAVTRASFTGFPTAFLGMLFVGLGIAASSQRRPDIRLR